MNDRQFTPKLSDMVELEEAFLDSREVQVPEFAQYAAEMLGKELSSILTDSVSPHYQELLKRAGVNVLDDVAERFYAALTEYQSPLTEKQVAQLIQLIDALDDQQSTELANSYRDTLLKLVPQGTPLHGRVLIEQGDALFEQGAEQEAVQCYREGILLVNAAEESYQVLALPRLETIAYLQLEEEEYEEAQRTYDDIIARCNRFPESTNIEILTALQEVATTFSSLQEYGQAEDVLLNLLRRTGTAVEFLEYRAQAMNTLGTVYAETNKFKAARNCYRLSLTELEQSLPANDVEHARVERLRSKYIDVLRRLGDDEELEKQLLKQQ